jgi:protein SCO1/2
MQCARLDTIVWGDAGMRRRAMLATILLALATGMLGSAAHAGLTRHDLADAGFHLVPNTSLPAAALLHGPSGDETLGTALAGKPALVVFTDYRCQSLCGVILDQLADALPKMTLDLRRDYNVISVALDSAQTQADASAFRDAHTKGSSLRTGGLFFTDDEPALRSLRASVGLVAPFDAEHKQFAHPAGLVLVDAEGRAKRILSPFALNPFDLKLALTETGAAPRSLAAHALLLCYGFDPASGVYTLRIMRVMAIAAAATIVVIAGTIGAFLWRERRLARRSGVPTL